MKYTLKIAVVCFVFAFFGDAGSLNAEDLSPRKEMDFNSGWRFIKSDGKGDKPPAEDAGWLTVDLPHDYSIESQFTKPAPNSGKKKKKKRNHDELGLYLGNKSTGYLPGGTGWYRKTFTLPDSFKNKNIEVLFDGVNVESDVWINGHHLGFHPYGYMAFHYNLTPFLKFDGENTIIVRSVNRLKSRWYPGSGIYRPVKLVVTDKVHVPVWGTFVTTPEVSDSTASVCAETKLKNDTDNDVTVTLKTSVVNSKGEVVAFIAGEYRIPASKETVVTQNLKIENVELWTLDRPDMYKLISEIKVGDDLVDKYMTPFGVRTLKFDPKNGFFLNGKYTKLKGACIHHDNGILGAKVFSWAEERKISKLKSMGYNAIRCAHNPPSEEFLNLCDRIGMLVIDEAFDEWKRGKAGGYAPYFDKWWRKDMTSMLLRDRNHPSIIMWSIGNEIPDQGFPEGVEIAEKLTALVHKLDPTRPTTMALQPGGKAWGNKFPPPEFISKIDVIGYNYEHICKKRGGDFIKNHKDFPDRIMYQSESQMKNTFKDWSKINSLKYILGDFVWTGFDYIGETGIGREKDDQKVFPGYIALCGDFNLCGYRKPRSFYKEIILTGRPLVHIAVHKLNSGNDKWKMTGWAWHPVTDSWTLPYPEKAPLTVEVYSGCDEVELFLNGKSLGRKKTSEATEYIASWTDVPYIPGELKAVGYFKGEKFAEHTLKSAGKPAKIKLTIDRKRIKAGGQDIAYATAEIVDENGVRVTTADNEITFSVEGPAKIAAVGTGSPYAPINYPFTGNKCRAFHGRATLIIRSTSDGDAGPVKIKALSESLTPGNVSLESNR